MKVETITLSGNLFDNLIVNYQIVTMITLMMLTMQILQKVTMIKKTKRNTVIGTVTITDNLIINKLNKLWNSLSPPFQESSVINQLDGVVYETKKLQILYIGKLLHCLIDDENWDIELLQIRCLKPKVGMGTILEDTPAHLPLDISSCK